MKSKNFSSYCNYGNINKKLKERIYNGSKGILYWKTKRIQ